jgi:predicted GNAT superfamily acetyltransferase
LTATVSIGPVPRERMLECQRLTRAVFGFREDETIPAWHLYTSTLFGGIARMALVDDAVAGFAYAFPAASGVERFLFLTELSVLPEHRSRGIGLCLVHAVRQAAIELGYDRMKWTTNALSGRNLHFYLARCGARIVRMRPLMYEQLLVGHSADGADGDEVEIDWRLHEQAVTVADDSDHQLVEIPWDVEQLRCTAPELRLAWRDRVRAAMTALLAEGYEGVDVAGDRGARRHFVVFARAAT